MINIFIFLWTKTMSRAMGSPIIALKGHATNTEAAMLNIAIKFRCNKTVATDNRHIYIEKELGKKATEAANIPGLKARKISNNLATLGP